MGKRKTTGFIQAFVDHHNNGYVPFRFYVWSAVSTIAAVLERKVWLPWFHGNVYPNMYVFLVAGPSEGKSSAIRPAVKLIKRCQQKHHISTRLLPNQTTEAQLLDILGETNYFTYKNKQYQHSSAYLVASEASMCFKNSEEHGIVKALTALYDSNDDFKKETVSRSEAVEIINPCINVIAGSTFFDLNNFLHRQGILGGFASRCTFVVEKSIKKKATGWYEEEDHKGIKEQVNTDLVHDLNLISKMTGGFTGTPEVKRTWLTWEKAYHEERADTKNEVLKAFMARKMLAMQKLMQILCVSDGDSMVINMENWEMAKRLVDAVEADIPGMLLEGQATDTKTHSGVKAAIINELKEKPGYHTRTSLLAELVLKGHDGTKLGAAATILIGDPNVIRKEREHLYLVGNPDLHL